MHKKKEALISVIVFAIILIFAFFKTYSLHSDYPFPYHHDEWQHLAFVVQSLEEGYNPQFNPYLNIPNFHTDLEAGFHLFLASFFNITGFDPILSYPYLAPFFAVLTSICLFLCIQKISKNLFISLMATIIFNLLPTNVNILGKDFFVPLTMAMPFIFLFSLFFIESINESSLRKLFISSFILIILFLIHPPSAIILIIPALFSFKPEIIKSFKKLPKQKNRIILGLIILTLLFLIFIIWRGSFEETKRYLIDLLLFEKGWGKLEITYFLPFLYGPVNTLLAVYGFFLAFKDEKYSDFRFFAFFSFIAISITALFNVFGFTILVPYSRAAHYAMLGMLPLTAIGIYRAKEIVFSFFSIKSKNRLLDILFVALIIASSLIFKYDLDKEYKNYTFSVIDEQDYSALLWIKQNIGKENIILTPYFMTSAVYPITQNRVVSLIPAVMGGGQIEDNYNFYSFNCSAQREIVIRANASLILSKTKLDCPYFEEIYSKKDFIYRIK